MSRFKAKNHTQFCGQTLAGAGAVDSPANREFSRKAANTQRCESLDNHRLAAKGARCVNSFITVKDSAIHKIATTHSDLCAFAALRDTCSLRHHFAWSLLRRPVTFRNLASKPRTMTAVCCGTTPRRLHGNDVTQFLRLHLETESRCFGK